MPKRAVSEVHMSTSQIKSGSDLPRERVELAVKLQEVSSLLVDLLGVYKFFLFNRVHSLCQIFRDSGKLGTGFKDS